MPLVTLDHVRAARAQIAGRAYRTPMVHSKHLSAIVGFDVYLKLEPMQKTGSFKVRGAINKIAALTPGERAKGVITLSAGNHAQGVAHHVGRGDDAGAARNLGPMPAKQCIGEGVERADIGLALDDRFDHQPGRAQRPDDLAVERLGAALPVLEKVMARRVVAGMRDRKSTRLNSSHRT